MEVKAAHSETPRGVRAFLMLNSCGPSERCVVRLLGGAHRDFFSLFVAVALTRSHTVDPPLVLVRRERNTGQAVCVPGAVQSHHRRRHGHPGQGKASAELLHGLKEQFLFRA